MFRQAFGHEARGKFGAKYPCDTSRRKRSDLVFAVIGNPLLYESKRQNRVSTSSWRPPWILEAATIDARSIAFTRSPRRDFSAIPGGLGQFRSWQKSHLR